MSNDDRLKALFAHDAPPQRDPAFSAAVMAGVMRRRFIADVLMLCGVSVLGALALWALWPSLHPVLVALSQSFTPALMAGAVALGAVAMLGGRQAPALLGLET